MWPLATYSYYFEISFYCDLSSLKNRAQLKYVSVNTVILYHSLYTITKV